MTTPMNTSIAGSITVTKRADLGLNLLVVEIGEAVEHLGQRAGRLADFDHLDGHVRHGLALEQRAGEALPFADLGRHDLELLAHVAVAGRARRDLDRVDQRNAAAEQRRQRARHLRRRELVEAGADERQLQQQAIELRAAARLPDPGVERRCRRRQRDQDQPELRANEVRDRHDDARRQRQFRIEAAVELRERRHHLHDDDADEHDRERRSG